MRVTQPADLTNVAMGGPAGGTVLHRWRYLAIAAAFVLASVLGDHHEGDAESVVDGASRLFSSAPDGGLHLYAHHPDLQIGPLAFAVVRLLTALAGGHALFGLVVGSLLLLLATVRVVEGALPDDAGRGVVLIGGIALACWWANVAPGWSHVDDEIAMLALAASLRVVLSAAVTPARAALAGALIGAGLAAKPWAAFGIAILVLLPRGRRLLGLAGAAAAALLLWGPFFIAAPRGLRALGKYRISARDGSLIHALGWSTSPSWDRPAQLVLATVLVLAAVRSRRPDLVLIGVAIARLLLDGGVFPYYSAELVLAGFVADAVRRPSGRLRWLGPAPTTVVAALALLVADLPTGSAALLTLRLLAFAAVAATAIVAGRAADAPEGAATVVRPQSGALPRAGRPGATAA